MPLITSITEQKKNYLRKKNNKDARFNIFLDSKYAFSLNEEIILKKNLKEGKTLTLNEVNSLKNEDAQKKLLDKAVNFLSYRPRSEKEVADYLIKTISKAENIKWHEAKESPLSDLIVEKLKKYGLIDDASFTIWWVNSRSKSRPKGRNLIEMELKRKGISSELIQKHLPDKAQTDILLALEVLRKKERVLSKLKMPELKRKAFNYLSNRGFDYDTIGEVFAIYTKKE